MRESAVHSRWKSDFVLALLPRMISVRQILVILSALLACGCSSPSSEQAAAPPDTRSWWKGDGVAGTPRIVIDLTEQRLRYYKGNELVGMSPISSGQEGRGTTNGKFRIIEKDLHHRSSLYGTYIDDSGNTVAGDVDSRADPRPAGARFLGANMRYFMRIVGGIGMHEGYLPGYPASHGCIRLPTKMAATFFRETPLGTPVEIVGHGHLAATEAAVPLGGSTPDQIPDDESGANDTTHAKPHETVRAALVEVRSPATPHRTTKRRWRKLKPGETLFLE